MGEGSAALLVTVQCVKSLRCTEFTGTAVADVVVEKVFQSNIESNLTLAEGSMVTIKSELESSLCSFAKLRRIVCAEHPVHRLFQRSTTTFPVSSS